MPKTKKIRAAGNDELPLFLDIFLSEKVAVTLAAKTIQTDESGNEYEQHLMYTGVVVDADDHFVYLGGETMAIEVAIGYSQIVTIEVLSDSPAEIEAMHDPGRPKKAEMN